MRIAEQKDRFTRLGLDIGILDHYREEHRFYHTIEHLDDICSLMQAKGVLDNDILFLATVFHDIIYDPRSATNEEDSAEYFESIFSGDSNVKAAVIQIILDTKTHKPSGELSEIFCDADLDILRRPFDKLLAYEKQIFKEFQFVDFAVYREKRVEVLQSLNLMVNNTALDALITYVRQYQPKIAVYPGSFNPFHKGHYNILQKAEQIFDKVIIARGINPGKDKSTHDLPQAIQYRQTASYEGLLTDYIEELGYEVTVIRGLRNGSDLQYELNQYRYLQELGGKQIKVVAVFCDMEFEHISSTGIRQLMNYGKAGDYLL